MSYVFPYYIATSTTFADISIGKAMIAMYVDTPVRILNVASQLKSGSATSGQIRWDCMYQGATTTLGWTQINEFDTWTQNTLCDDDVYITHTGGSWAVIGTVSSQIAYATDLSTTTGTIMSSEVYIPAFNIFSAAFLFLVSMIFVVIYLKKHGGR